VLAALDAGCDLALLCNQSLGNGSVIDDTIDGLAQAQLSGRWQARPASEARRLALLHAAPAADWGPLMRTPDYLRALALIP